MQHSLANSILLPQLRQCRFVAHQLLHHLILELNGAAPPLHVRHAHSQILRLTRSCSSMPSSSSMHICIWPILVSSSGTTACSALGYPSGAKDASTDASPTTLPRRHLAEMNLVLLRQVRHPGLLAHARQVHLDFKHRCDPATPRFGHCCHLPHPLLGETLGHVSQFTYHCI